MSSRSSLFSRGFLTACVHLSMTFSAPGNETPTAANISLYDLSAPLSLAWHGA